MEIFFDTSVLVASFVEGHAHHNAAFPAVDAVIRGRNRGALSVHSVAETYAVLTKLPVAPAIHPAEAHRMIAHNVLPHFTLVPLEPKDYTEVLDEAMGAGWRGGLIYDALLLKCAEKRRCQRIYTFNVAHFQKIAPHLKNRISAPA
ncbi:MAG: PIN domain-containing protein [Bryobacteraceae bacterium]